MDKCKEFSDEILGYLLENNDGAKTLAREFEVAVSTIGRWSKGTSCPLPGIRDQILAYIKES